MPEPTRAEMAERGFSFKEWVLSPTTTVSNFYRSYSVIKNNIGPQDKLHFRTFKPGENNKPDKYGEIYQATHLHVPLLRRDAALAKEAITGFKIDKTNGQILEEFGVLNGIFNIVPSLGWTIFSENEFADGPLGVSNDLDSMDKTHSGLPKLPDELWTNIINGQQVNYFDLSGNYFPFKIQYVFNSKLYYNYDSGVEKKYRALYLLESLGKSKSDIYSGRHRVIGFGVSSNKKLRGLGSIGTHFADKVRFLPQQ